MSRGLDALRTRLNAPDADAEGLIRALTTLGYTETQRVGGDVLMSTDRFAVWVPVGDEPDDALLDSAREFVIEHVRSRLAADAAAMLAALDAVRAYAAELAADSDHALVDPHSVPDRLTRILDRL